MPYIDAGERAKLDNKIDTLSHEIKLIDGKTEANVDNAGRLNYAITRLCLGVFPHRKYWVIALVCDVLVNVMLEYYRRLAAPYEDTKIAANGDVHGYDTPTV